MLTKSLVSKSQIKELIMCIDVAVHKSNVISTTCGVAKLYKVCFIFLWPRALRDALEIGLGDTTVEWSFNK